MAGKIALRLIHSLVEGWRVDGPVEVQGPDGEMLGVYPEEGGKILRSVAAGNQFRPALPFRAVNRAGSIDYDPGLQRHHLLPRQLLSRPCFAAMFDMIGCDRLGFHDFRRNGLLLPADGAAAMRMGLPLHRGPHRDCNALVVERVGQVEARWSETRGRMPEAAMVEAVQRLAL
ncbi:hypothetical protein KXV85_003561, partial [Aspergillus fumigatus]